MFWLAHWFDLGLATFFAQKRSTFAGLLCSDVGAKFVHVIVFLSYMV